MVLSVEMHRVAQMLQDLRQVQMVGCGLFEVGLAGLLQMELD